MNREEEYFPTRMVRLGLSTPEEKREYEYNKIQFNKLISRINAEARNNAKRNSCLICGNKCTGFCNSHSIPKFCLQKIAEGGMVLSPLQEEIPTLGKNTGVGKAGTFHLICNDCDSKVFQDYENPSAYSDFPSDRMLAQIAMKNYLQMISKRNEEQELYAILGQRYPQYKSITDERQFIGATDLFEYQTGYKRAKKASLASTGKYYYLCYFRILDYVVPYAAQGIISMISDFEDNTINDLFNFSPDYQIKNIHVAVFPLESTSVVMLFVEEGEKRYRKFYRQLRQLTPEDQLAAINYIIFSYTENVFLNKTIAKSMQENQIFMDTCRKSVDAVSSLPFAFEYPLTVAIKDFSLSKRHEIPNLLSQQYAL